MHRIPIFLLTWPPQSPVTLTSCHRVVYLLQLWTNSDTLLLTKIYSWLNIQKTKIMASCPSTSWQIGGEIVETVTDLIFWAPKSLQMMIAAMKLKDVCSLEENYDQLRQHIKKQSHYFANKGLCSQGYGFAVAMYGCESWTIKKAERRRIDAFELWCWRRLLRVPWTAKRSNQSILKEISPEYSLEGLTLKLKL